MLRSPLSKMALVAFLSPAMAPAQAGASTCHATPQEARKQVPWAGNAGEIQWSADQPDCKVDASGLAWLSVSFLPPGTGNASQRVLRYAVDTNFSTAKREGKIQVGDSTVILEQDGGPAPGMAYSPSSLEFTYNPDKDRAAEITKELFVGSDQPLLITATPEKTAPWIVLKTDAPETPRKQRSFQVTVSAEGKGPGVYKASIQIEAPGASNSRELVPVTLTVEGSK
jgi:hypothetical protein